MDCSDEDDDEEHPDHTDDNLEKGMEKPSIRVSVPDGSYLFKTREVGSSTLTELLFLSEVYSLITTVLNDPPETLKSVQSNLLEYVLDNLYILSSEAIISILNTVFEIVPSMDKRK